MRLLQVLGQAEFWQSGFRMEIDPGATFPQRKPGQASAVIIMTMADHNRLSLFQIQSEHLGVFQIDIGLSCIEHNLVPVTFDPE